MTVQEVHHEQVEYLFEQGFGYGLDLPERELSLAARVNGLLYSADYSPEALIDVLKSDHRLAKLLSEPAVREGYTIEEHTLMVLRQFEKYYGDKELPGSISREEMRLLLVFHDIGKGIGADRGDQHTYTMQVMNGLRRENLFTESTFKLITAPLEQDALGKYFYLGAANGPSAEEKLVYAQKIAREGASESDLRDFVCDIELEPAGRLVELARIAAKSITDMAKRSEMSPDDILEILTVYYQCDTLAYTFDAARDPERSTVLDASEVANIRFNHDKALTPIPGLEMRPGDASWNAYAALETAARNSEPDSFPIERGYPSLDFLYELADTPDLTGDPRAARLFQFDQVRGRLAFSRQFEGAYALLEKFIKAQSVYGERRIKLDDPSDYVDPFSGRTIRQLEQGPGRVDSPEMTIDDMRGFNGLMVVMGGTFDPFHYGHLISAYAVRSQLAEQYDVPANEIRFVFVPAHQNPHKEDAPLATDAQRYGKIANVLEDHPGFYVSNLELREEIDPLWEKHRKSSYSINTVERIKEVAPEAKIVLTVGAEYVSTLHSWHRVNELLENADVAFELRTGHEDALEHIGMHHRILAEINQAYRPGDRAKKLRLNARQVKELDEHLVEVPAIEISSTRLRKLLADTEGLVVAPELPLMLPPASLKFAIGTNPEVYIGRSFEELEATTRSWELRCNAEERDAMVAELNYLENRMAGRI